MCDRRLLAQGFVRHVQERFGHGTNNQVDLSKETTLFNKVVTKINQNQKEQERTVVVTGKHIYNLKPALKHFQRKIEIKKLRKSIHRVMQYKVFMTFYWLCRRSMTITSDYPTIQIKVLSQR